MVKFLYQLSAVRSLTNVAQTPVYIQVVTRRAGCVYRGQNVRCQQLDCPYAILDNIAKGKLVKGKTEEGRSREGKKEEHS